MRLLARTFEKTRVLVALALLLSVGAPLAQYACGVTGEAFTTSTLAVEVPGSNAAPCGALSGDVHDRLCGSSPGCDGAACTTDTVEAQSGVHSGSSSFRIAPALPGGDLSSDEEASSHRIGASSLSAPSADGTVRDFNRIPVRFRTLSFWL
jgi:hypothetical protein